MNPKLLLRTCVLTSLLCLPSLALADSLNLTLSNPSQAGVAGTVFTYNGTISAPVSNSGADFLLGDNFTTFGNLMVDDSAFFMNTPLFLNPGQSFSGALFSITATPSSMSSLTTGIFTVIGQDANNNVFSSNTATFSAAVTPEPPSVTLLALGALVGGLFYRQRQSLLA